MWRRFSDNSKNRKSIKSEELSYLTYDLKTNGLGHSPSVELLRILNIKRLCHAYMQFMGHPGYVLEKRYGKPIECEETTSNVEEEEKIKKIMSDHFSDGSRNRKTNKNASNREKVSSNKQPLKKTSRQDFDYSDSDFSD